MSKQDLVELEGVITQICPGGKFKVQIMDENGEVVDQQIYCTLSGKLRQNHIKIVIGDKVTVNVSPYDLTKGIISWRFK